MAPTATNEAGADGWEWGIGGGGRRAAPRGRPVLSSHRLIVAGGFQVAGWALGAPSLLAALGLATGAFIVGHGAPPDHSPYLRVGDYGLVGLLANGAHGIDAVFSFLGGVAGWVMGLLAVVALMAAVFAGLLYLVGRGLKASAAWARAVGLLLCGVLLVNGLGALAALPPGAAMVDGVAVAGFAYVLWVLGWRFADRPPGASPAQQSVK